MVNNAANNPIEDRIRELFGDEPIPYPLTQYGMHPAFQADFHMNFKRFVWSDGYLNVNMKAAIALAISFATGCRPWQDVLERRVIALGFPEAAEGDIRALVAVTAMFNVFFKLPDLSGSRFGGMGVGLRGHTLAATCLDEQTIELISVAISTINGCKLCTAGHVRVASQTGLDDQAILEAIQCAATMLAGCTFLNAL
jgi:alkyl hydroperoxide reductase subunit D